MGKHKKEKKHKEKKNKRKHKKKHYSSDSSSSSTEDEWIEKDAEKPVKEPKPQTNPTSERDEWMNLTSLAGLYSKKDQRKKDKEEKKEEKEASKYNPQTSVRELNPYWRDGGDGLPSAIKASMFKKPEEDSYDYNKGSSRSQSNWRKRSPKRDRRSPDRRSPERRSTDRRNPDRRSPNRSSVVSREESPELEERNSKSSNRNSSSNWRKRSPKRDRRSPDRRSPNRSPDRRNPDRRSPDRSPVVSREHSSKYSNSNRSSNWRKKSPKRDSRSPDRSPKITELPTSSKTSDIIYESRESSPEIVEEPEISLDYLTDKEMNDIGAKIVKAEILGNLERVAELKAKLEKARIVRDTHPRPVQQEEEVLLTHTNAKGISKPINEPSNDFNAKRKKKTLNTHDAGKRQKYYPDDGKQSLQNMFENEKFGNSYKQEEEFMKAASKLSKSDDLDDMFMDNIRKKDSDEKMNRKDRDKAIQEQQRISQSLDRCQHCIQSSSMLKHLMVTLGETVFLSLPQYEPITDGHCLLIPVRHVPCSTQLDENEWAEILQFRKSLTTMFKSENKTVVFYETAVNINSYPHMIIHCVPMPEEEGDMAPIYFKKGIDECEKEWSTNKKLINMAGKDVRRSVPKGLPYFWVSFGMKEGFAHVIEEQKYFPKYFAEEIIGGILDLHHSKWRKSTAQKFEAQKVRMVDFSKNWTKFDCTVKQ